MLPQLSIVLTVLVYRVENNDGYQNVSAVAEGAVGEHTGEFDWEWKSLSGKGKGW